MLVTVGFTDAWNKAKHSYKEVIKMIIYKTDEWKGYGEHNYYWNEYRLEEGRVVKYRCRRHKHSNGDDAEWEFSESYQTTWSMNDPDMPGWLRKHI